MVRRGDGEFVIKQVHGMVVFFNGLVYAVLVQGIYQVVVEFLHQMVRSLLLSGRWMLSVKKSSRSATALLSYKPVSDKGNDSMY